MSTPGAHTCDSHPRTGVHELALSESIVRSTLEATGAEPGSITRIGLRVGALSGVNVASLEFCMRAVLHEHGMRDAEVEIEPAPAVLECTCGASYEAEDLFSPCPGCGAFDRRIVEGQDVTVEYVEVEDAQT